MFTPPDRIGQVAAEHHRHMLAEARQRALRHPSGRRSSRMPSVAHRITYLATAIARGGAAVAGTPVAIRAARR